MGETLRRVFLRPTRTGASSWPASPATSTGSSRWPTPPWPAGARWPPSGARWPKNVALARRLGLLEHPRRRARRHRGRRPLPARRGLRHLHRLPGRADVGPVAAWPPGRTSGFKSARTTWWSSAPTRSRATSGRWAGSSTSLHRRGAEVIHSGAEAVHVSGHARQGELATLMSVTEPECFVPVHGEYRHMVHHARLAASMGVARRPGAAVRGRRRGPPRRRGLSPRRHGARPATSTWTARSATSATGCCGTARCWPRRAWSWSVVTVDLQHGRAELPAEIDHPGLGATPPRPRSCWTRRARWSAPRVTQALRDGAARLRGAQPPRPQGAGQVRGGAHPAPAR